MLSRLNMPIQRQGNLFTKFPQIFGWNWVYKFERHRQTAKQTFDNNTQGSSTAHTFLPGMYISLVSYIFDLGLWPMQGIRLRHGQLDLSHKNEKTHWTAFELNRFCWNLLCFFPELCNSQKEKRSGRLSPDQTATFSRPNGDFTRPKPGAAFLMHCFPLGQEHIPVQPHPRPIARANSCNCNTPVYDSWG